MGNILERLLLHEGEGVFNDLIFRLDDSKTAKHGTENDLFVLMKTRTILHQYKEYWASRETFHPQNIFELGIWEGGSIALWFEYFSPQKYVAVDYLPEARSKHLGRYVESRDLKSRIKTYWGVDQFDSLKLREIIDTEFDRPLDLVFDDASHMFARTKSSFEILFPKLRAGGLYLIEDWAWEYSERFRELGDAWSTDPGLTKLILEFIQAIGKSTFPIRSLTVYPGFLAVERGD